MTTRTYKVDTGLDLLTSAAPRPAGTFARAGRRLRRWLALSRQRRALAALDDRLLKDVGLDQESARRESARWFWDEPAAQR